MILSSLDSSESVREVSTMGAEAPRTQAAGLAFAKKTKDLYNIFPASISGKSKRSALALAALQNSTTAMSAFGLILLKNSWLEKRTCMRVSYFEARSLKKNSSQLSHAFICENLVRKGSKIVFQQYWGQSGRSTYDFFHQDSECLLSPKAVIRCAQNQRYCPAAFGQ